MSKAELVIPKKQQEDSMWNGFIHQSSLSFAAPVLFAKKADWDPNFVSIMGI